MGHRFLAVMFGWLLLAGCPVLAAEAAPERWRVALPEADGLSGDGSSPFAVLHRRWWAALASEAGAELVLSTCSTPEACADAVARGEVDFTGPAYWNPDTRLAYTRPVARIPYVAVHRPERQVRDMRALHGQDVMLDEALQRERAELLDYGVNAVEAVSLEAGTSRLRQDASAILVTEEHRVDFGASGLAATGLWTRWLFVQGAAAPIARLDALADSLSNGVRALESSYIRPGMRFPHLLQEIDRLHGPREAWMLVEARPVIELGASRWEPLTVVTDHGFDGLGLRLASHHYERAGLTPVYSGSEDWRAVRADAESGRYGGLGFVVAGGMVESPLRYSEMITDMPLVALARADEAFWTSPEDLVGLRVVSEPSYAELRNLEGIRRVDAQEPLEMLRMLRDGEVDAWIEYLPIAERAIEFLGARDVKIALRVGGPTDLRTAVHDDYADALPLLNDSIASSSQASLDAAIADFSDPLFPSAEPAEDSYVAFALATVGVFGLLAIVAVLRLRTARRSLRQRDRAMRRAQLFARVGSFEMYEGSDDVYLDGETPALLGLDVDYERIPFEDLAACFHQRDAVAKLLEQVRESGEADGIEVYAPSLERWFRWELTVEAGGATPARRVIGTIRDITDDREHAQREMELEREVFELQKLDAIGQLAAGIAHDFNNALAANIGFTEEAQAKLATDHPAQEDLQYVLRSSLRSRDLVQQILAFSRETEDQFEPVRLDAIVSESVELVRASSPASVRIETRWPEEELWVDGNATRLSQIAVNLIKNAVDAAGRDGRVQIEVVPCDEAPSTRPVAKLVIRDDGIGISPALRARIFEPFFTTKGMGQGSGLGLAVVHGLVKAHKGHIDVNSEPGEGAEFVVSLPCVSAPEAQAGPAASADVEPAVARIVVVDDEPLIVRVFERTMERRGYHVVGFEHPEQAIAHFEQGATANVLVTDLTMPGMTGVELAERVRALAPEIELVLMSGNTLELDAGTSELFGHVLEKPVLRSAILAAVEAATQRGEARAGAPVGSAVDDTALAGG